MTRPSDVKPREGELPGTRWEEFEVGAELPEFSFTLTPDVVQEYSSLIESKPQGYKVDGQRYAVPSVLSLYLMAVLYRKYPPAQGGIMASNKFWYVSPLAAGAATDIVASGAILEKYEKRGRRYVRYSAEFRNTEGNVIARAENLSTFPDPN
jgi:hypothetical protein